MNKNDVIAILLLCIGVWAQGDDECSNNGVSVNGTCVCNPGFIGNLCQHCHGRFVLNATSGFVSNGPRVGGITRFDDCLGIISLPDRNNSVIRLHFSDVATLCSCDFLTVYDGDSLHAPVLATFNGDLLPTLTQEIASTSSAVAFRFYNDGTDFEEPGYYIRYSVEKKTKEETNSSTPITTGEGAWRRHTWNNTSIRGRASGAVARLDRSMYAFGGLQFGETFAGQELIRLDLSTLEWSEVRYETNSSSLPESRHGHIMAVWKDVLVVHGGALHDYSVTNQVWIFNITEGRWWELDGNKTEASPHLFGHTGHVIKDALLVLFGYSPHWDVSSFLFEMDLETSRWSKIETSGPLPVATYGHASALDEANHVIYVHGGFNDIASDKLHSYDVIQRKWTVLPSSPQYLYLHSLVMMEGSLYTFGGKTNNLEKCDSCEMVMIAKYDIACMEWSDVDENLRIASDRFGHSAILSEKRTMLVFGGYDGTMLNDVISYTVIDCSAKGNRSECDANSDCVWAESQCERAPCEADDSMCDKLCLSQTSCGDCLSTSCTCCFDSLVCTHYNTSDAIEECNVTDCQDESRYCSVMRSCSACDEAGCLWVEGVGCTTKQGNDTSTPCRESCAERSSCRDCVSQSECSWCKTTATCFRHGTDAIFFPYGQCLDYDDTINSCFSDSCSRQQNCDDCFADYRCGWCDYGTTTGFGACLAGSLEAPIDDDCPPTEWNFDQCPACQCNGHSNCTAAAPDVCELCETGTTGEKCEECDRLYYGDAKNGKQCSPCECNGHAKDCSTEGVCLCDVEGIEGRNCDLCYSDFNGNPVNDTCRFTMAVMKKYTFPLFQEASPVNKFNFESCPPYRADVTINLEIPQNQNESVDVVIATNTSADWNETIIAEYQNVTLLNLKLPQLTYQFGWESNRCLRIYISSIELPITITVWLYQPFINVWKLVAIFLITLVSLLLLTACLWKIYNAIMRVRRRRVVQVEMERLAARPLSEVHLDTDDLDTTLTKQESGKNVIEVVAQESCQTGRASVCTTLLWLPSNDIGSRIVFGSVLATNPLSAEQKQSTRGIDNPTYSPDSA